MADLTGLLADLAAEHEALDGRVATLSEADWHRPTPAEGWDIADSVSHLAYYDRTAVLALTDPPAFAAHRKEVLASGGAPDTAMGRSEAPAVLLEEWRKGRVRLHATVGDADPATRVEWYGPAMSLASFVTARMMETWAHGTDVADALGLAPVQGAALRHVVHLGVRARPYAFAVHGLEDPGTPVAVVAGDEVFGESSAPERIVGSMLDLALVFTQRRHPTDTGVGATGPTAQRWLGIAQAFAGPAGPGRSPGAR